MDRYDVAVLGGGPGGYVAAIKAAQTGARTALIEMGEMGGTCLNRGCIPSKALLANADVLYKIKHAEEFGINIDSYTLDFAKMVERKTQVVTKIRKSLEGLIKANRIEVIAGFGQFVAPKELKVTGDTNVHLAADKIIIATGSEPRNIPVFPFDGKRILSSTDILNLQTIPSSLAIIGGGVIGCEFASLFSELGTHVTILEALDSIIALEGKDMSSALAQSFKKRGVDIRTGVMVEGIETLSNGGVSVRFNGNDSIGADFALVAVGRKLNTDKIGLDKAGIPVTDKGVIPVNEKMETEVEGVYAIGDITAKWMLAHVASHQGIVAAANATGGDMKMHYQAVPSVVYTHPEIATVGLNPEQAKEAGYANPKVSRYPFNILGKSIAANDIEGFAQIVSDPQTGKILGAQVIGHEASVLIAEIALAKNNELTLDCITETIHAHPTIAEAWLESALIASDTPIHFPPRKKS